MGYKFRCEKMAKGCNHQCVTWDKKYGPHMCVNFVIEVAHTYIGDPTPKKHPSEDIPDNDVCTKEQRKQIDDNWKMAELRLHKKKKPKPSEVK